jgi:two-component system chemotaxis response regulator CheY
MTHEPHFLIVDEFSTMRGIIRSLLKDCNFTSTDEAENGSAALHKLHSNTFDFVITDTHIPHLNGFELLAAMKKDEKLKHIPVLLVTAESRKEDILRAAQLGAAGYVVKPFTEATLQDKILGALRRSKPKA